jgi:hypothetical protein
MELCIQQKIHFQKVAPPAIQIQTRSTIVDPKCFTMQYPDEEERGR